MALPSSGALKFSDINIELGVASNTQRSLGGATTRTLYGIASGQIRLAADGYGKSTVPVSYNTWYDKLSNISNWQPQSGGFVDNSGNVYQYLTSAASSVYGYGFIKVNSTGDVQFQKTVSANNISRYIQPGTKTGAINNTGLYAVVNDEPTNSGANYALNLVKYDLTGAISWNRRVNLNTLGIESQVRLAIDSSGNSYIFSGDGSANIYIFKHTTTGTFSLQTSFNSVFNANAIACDGSGNIYIAANLAASNLIFVAKLTSTGTLTWRRTISSGTLTNPVINSISVSSSGLIGLAGYFTSGATQYGLMMVLSSTGAINWQRYTTSVSNMYGVVCDSTPNFYFVGTTSTGTQSWLAKYNSTGTLQFQRTLGGTGTQVRDIGISSASTYLYITLYPSTSNVGLISLPVDGTKTGSYSTLSYTASAYTETTPNFATGNANSYNQNTPAFTSTNASPPPAIANSAFTITKTNIP